MNTKLAGKSDASHSHAWSTITGKPTSFSPSSHTHDDRYYTEAEVNNIINTRCPFKIVQKSYEGNGNGSRTIAISEGQVLQGFTGSNSASNGQLYCVGGGINTFNVPPEANIKGVTYYATLFVL